MNPRLATGLLVLLVSGGCATYARPVPHPLPRTEAATEPRNRSPRVSADAIIRTALALRGAPYRNGGADPGGFDCSGFVQYVFAENGQTLPRRVSDLAHLGRSIDVAEIGPADLLLFSTVTRGPSHVAIAIGPDQFVHAPSGAGRVRVEHLSASYWRSRFIGARRIDDVAADTLAGQPVHARQ